MSDQRTRKSNISLWRRIRGELPLIVSSLIVATAIWLIAKQGGLATDWIDVPLVIDDPPENVQVQAPPRVQINVQYPRDMGNRIVSKKFSVHVKAGDIFSGEAEQWKGTNLAAQREYQLTPANVMIEGDQLRGVLVIGLDPQKIMLTAHLVTSQPLIDVVTTGTLPSNYAFTAPPRAAPPQVTVTGSTEAIRRLVESGNKIPTATVDLARLPIDLTRITKSGRVYPELLLPPGIKLLNQNDSQVTVNINLMELNVRKMFPQVPVNLLTLTPNLAAKTTPATVDIYLEGPSSALEELKQDDFIFRPATSLAEQEGKMQEIGIEAQLKSRVSPEIAERVRILEVKPPRITVEFVPQAGQNGSLGLMSVP